MKNIATIIMFSLATTAMLWSCEKDENKIFLEGGTPPVLTAITNSTAEAISLSFADADKQALELSWTNPNYNFTTGTSSQDVSYLIEIDTAGANFSNPQKQTIAISKELGKSFKVSVINDYLLNQLQLKPGMEHQLEMRVKSSLLNNAALLTSNVLPFAVTPYAIPPKVEPPASGELYITGDALASGWTNSPPAPQKFTQVSTTLYELVVDLNGGKSYTFLPVWGSWDSKYSIAKKNDPDLVNGGDFKAGGEDILAPAASGSYKIQVDFQRGKFTVAKQ